jgi:hypothetical protein
VDATEQATEQVMRMTILGTEVALRLTGAGAKNLAAALFSIASNQEKTKGKTRLASLLKSGKPLHVFSIDSEDLKKFASEAKRYGLLYTIVRDASKQSERIEIMVKAEDGSKVNRIVEKLGYGKFEVADIVSEIEQSLIDKIPDALDVGVPTKNIEDSILDELLEKPLSKEAHQSENPTAAKTDKSPRSEPTSKTRNESARGTSNHEPLEVSKTAATLAHQGERARRSVKAEIAELKTARKEPTSNPVNKNRQSTHKQPPQTRNRKSKTKPKER